MNAFEQRLLQTPFLIATHRGLRGGNVIENTIESARLAFAAGSDMAEVDVCRTADGAYYLFHDGMEPRRYGISTNFRDLSSEFVRHTPLRNTLGEPSGKFAVTLKDLIASLDPGQLINLDRSWFFWKDGFLGELEAMGKKEQILLKSPPEPELLEMVAKTKFPYMPILQKKEDYDACLAVENLPLVGVEWVMRNPADWDEDFVDRVHANGHFIFVNAETLDGGNGLFGNWNDDAALSGGFDAGWGELLRRGADIIQTDWPMFLNQERQRILRHAQAAIAKSERSQRWKKPEEDLEAIAVYGYVLDAKGNMQGPLLRRLQVALEVAQTHPAAKILVSGGHPRGGNMESAVMKAWLVEQGVDATRILEDPEAFDTYDNQTGFLRLLQEGQMHKVCIVTSRLHVPRCLLGLQEMSRWQGYSLDISVAYSEDDSENALMQSLVRFGENMLALRNYMRCSGRNSFRLASSLSAEDLVQNLGQWRDISL